MRGKKPTRKQLEGRGSKALERLMQNALHSKKISMDQAFGRHQIVKEKIAANHVIRFDLKVRDGKKIKEIYNAIERFPYAFRENLSMQECRKLVEISGKHGTAAAKARMKNIVSQQEAGLREAFKKVLGDVKGEKCWNLFKEKVKEYWSA